MWWNVYNEISKRMADQFSTMLTPPPSKPAQDKPQRSKHVDAMIRKISEDLATMADHERDLVKAELAERAREWCLKDMSHDLRTPLNAIIGFAQLMENGTFGSVGNPQYLEYLRHIRESGYELLDRVEGLIDTVSPNATSDVVHHLKQPSNQHHALLTEAVA
jgi:signal transduction histidine kinase